MVAPGRVELPTFGLGNRCSIHLSYGAVVTKEHLRELQSNLMGPALRTIAYYRIFAWVLFEWMSAR